MDALPLGAGDSQAALSGRDPLLRLHLRFPRRDARCLGAACHPCLAATDVMGNWKNIPVYLAEGDIQEIVRSSDGSWLKFRSLDAARTSG